MMTQPIIPERAIILDTETTGFTPKAGHRIVELAAIEYVDGAPTGRHFHSYLDPGRKVDPQAEATHGLSNAFLKGKPRFRDIADDFLAFLEDLEVPIYAHNASFDQRFVDAELDWAKKPGIGRFTCTLKIARRLITAKNHKLETLAEAIGHDWSGRGAHSALSDCDALGNVLATTLWPALAAAPAPTAKKPKKAAARAPAPKAEINLPDDFVPISAAEDTRLTILDVSGLKPYLTARGKRWSAQEEAQAAEAFLKGEDIEAMVRAHGRTPAALMMKLETLGIIAGDHPYARA